MGGDLASTNLDLARGGTVGKTKQYVWEQILLEQISNNFRLYNVRESSSAQTVYLGI